MLISQVSRLPFVSVVSFLFITFVHLHDFFLNFPLQLLILYYCFNFLLKLSESLSDFQVPFLVTCRSIKLSLKDLILGLSPPFFGHHRLLTLLKFSIVCVCYLKTQSYSSFPFTSALFLVTLIFFLNITTVGS